MNHETLIETYTGRESTTGHAVTPLLHTKVEAAAMLNISLRTIDNLIALKELAVRRIGRRVLIPHNVLVTFAQPKHRKAA